MFLVATRAASTDFGMGGDRSPPIGGGPKGGDNGPMGGISAWFATKSMGIITRVQTFNNKLYLI